MCLGACCETLLVPVPDVPIITEFMSVRGHREGDYYRLECKCPMLDENGKCKIYESRPQICRDYEAGSELCLKAIKARRSGIMLGIIENYMRNRRH